LGRKFKEYKGVLLSFGDFMEEIMKKGYPEDGGHRFF
jgi:hypothetical protein